MPNIIFIPVNMPPLIAFHNVLSVLKYNIIIIFNDTGSIFLIIIFRIFQMKLYFKAVTILGTILLAQSAYAHNGEDHSGGDLSFIPPAAVKPTPVVTTPVKPAPVVTTPPASTTPYVNLLPKPNPITPIVTPVAEPAPVHNHGTTTLSPKPNQQFVTSVPSTKPTALPPLLTFTPLAPKPPIHNHETMTPPVHTMTGGSGGVSVSEPLGLLSVLGAMMGFMMVRRKKNI